MHFGISVATLGDYANPRSVVPLAQAAEAAGWEGFFVWDHLAFAWGVPSGDPWVILAAVAQATARLKLGTAITPLPRRRPHVLANTVATLDQLSAGRVIFGAGLGGVPREFSAFGEPDDPRERANSLTKLWTFSTGCGPESRSITEAPITLWRMSPCPRYRCSVLAFPYGSVERALPPCAGLPVGMAGWLPVITSRPRWSRRPSR